LRYAGNWKNMRAQRWEFDHIDILPLDNYPESYGSIRSTGVSGRFMDRMTQFDVIRAFKEFAT